MFRQIFPLNRTRSGKDIGAYVRVTTKMIYFSSGGNFDLVGKYVDIFYDKENEWLLFSVNDNPTKNSFKISPCHEANRAGRIETWNTVKSLKNVGFPLEKLGDPIRTLQLPDGSIIANLKEVQS